jgi:hypothetical protein
MSEPEPEPMLKPTPIPKKTPEFTIETIIHGRKQGTPSTFIAPADIHIHIPAIKPVSSIDGVEFSLEKLLHFIAYDTLSKEKRDDIINDYKKKYATSSHKQTLKFPTYKKGGGTRRRKRNTRRIKFNLSH